MAENTLNYRSPRDETRRWRPSARQTGLGLLLLLGTIVVGWIFLIGPTNEQFRLDTGDWRYTYFGIAGHTIRMDEPERSTIVSLAAGSAVLKPEWISVGDTVGHYTAFDMFRQAARLAKVNPQISKDLLEVTARYVKGSRPPHWTTFIDILYSFKPVGPGVWKPRDPSKEKEVVDYLKSKGLPIPSTAPAATTAPAVLRQR